MLTRLKTYLIAALTLIAIGSVTGSCVVALSSGPAWSTGVRYGFKSDVALAEALWRALCGARMAGPDRLNVHAFAGRKPHAIVQQIWAGNVMVQGRMARAVVKANHTSHGATIQSVYDHPNKYLTSYTVMFQNIAGYDPQNRDWFWVKFGPDGQIDKDTNGVAIAGRVDSPSGFGCAACHRKLGGKDLETFTSK